MEVFRVLIRNKNGQINNYLTCNVMFKCPYKLYVLIIIMYTLQIKELNMENLANAIFISEHLRILYSYYLLLHWTKHLLLDSDWSPYHN